MAEGQVFDNGQLKSALNAFKKRVKLTKLDQESKLGGGRPVTSGKRSDIVGMQPPREYPKEIWAELVKQGKIKDMGGGYYAPI
ncbi:MAG: hypothetical protein JSR77_12060 [Planctomycetes bacterium]|nr:hypothetical protein [Planctomycetota bacterium]